MRRASVLIPSWNGRHHLATCLEALAAQHDPGVPWDVWVLDNGSTDGTVAWLRDTHPRVRVVESAVNLGFAAAVDRLVEAADGDALALLNNDTRPEPGWLGELVAALAGAPARVAAVSGKIVSWEGDRLDFAEGVMTFDGHAFQKGFRRPLAEVDLPAAGAPLPFACGGNMMVRREPFEALGGFDPDYFAYFEDVDFGWRLSAAGHEVRFAPGAVVRHRSAATSDLLGAYRRGVLFERNAFLTAYKNYDEALWPRMMPVVLLTLLARSHALLAGGNPGGELLLHDPFAPGGAAAAAPPAPGAPRRWLLRAWRRVGRLLGAEPPPATVAGETVDLRDPRSIAQLQAVAFLLGRLDRAAEKRRRAQACRRVPDAELFARFPLYLVPTYPGDERLFADPGFRSWLPADLPLVEAALGDLMAG